MEERERIKRIKTIEENYINNTLTNLNKEEKECIKILHFKLMEAISIAHDIPYEDMIEMNEQKVYVILEEILLLLLPYINESNMKELKNITKLTQIYKQKDDTGRYMFSNMEYNVMEDYTEKELTIKDIYTNYKLLLNTIHVTSHRLMPNWKTIIPVSKTPGATVNNRSVYYKDLQIYKNMIFKKLECEQFDDDRAEIDAIDTIDAETIIREKDKIGLKYNQLYAGTVYNTIIYILSNNANRKDYIKQYVDEFKRLNALDMSLLKSYEGRLLKWEELSTEEKKVFLKKFNMNIDIDDKDIMIDIVFRVLCELGTLTVYNKFSSKDEYIRENYEAYDNDRYYLTELTYKEMDNEITKCIQHDYNSRREGRISTKIEEQDLRREITSKEIDIINKEEGERSRQIISFRRAKKEVNKRLNYSDYYSLMWTSQIKFYHKFINCRVLLITGGTGVGKSTQIPKLVLYGLKAFDWNDNGKIINTQPRISPTKENADRIALQMGIVIEKYYPNKFVQYQTSDDTVHNIDNTKDIIKYEPYANKSNRTGENLTLKIVTDGTLMNEILNAPLLIKNNHNIYDIIMIDESHEHNTNMDMILTIVKQYLYYNNSVRLMIISATMEEDEMIYRRYYKVIDDNMKYPITRELYNLETNKLEIDRKTIDRRVNISEPGKSTIYKIEEHYEDKNIESEDEKNARILEIIEEIKMNSRTKDILIFKDGRENILKCIKYLNERIDKDMICLPVMSNGKYEDESIYDIITHIDNEEIRRSIRCSKDLDMLTASKLDVYTGNNVYRRFILIGTNVVEASITIDTLTHVIDDGKQKISEYNYDTQATEFKTCKIAESNRKQRRGRVGRTNDGTVYYLYKSDYLLNEVPKYKICIDDIINLQYNLLPTDRNTVLFKEDPTITGDVQVDNKMVKDFIKSHYTLPKFAFSEYKKQEPNYKSILNNKFSYEDLKDDKGEFYIIHPKEIEYGKRDILGKVKNKVEYDLERYLDKEMNYKMIDKINNIIYKTIFGDEMSRLTVELGEDMKLENVMMLILGMRYGCLREISYILYLIERNKEKEIKIEQTNIEDSDIMMLYEKYKNDMIHGINRDRFKAYYKNIDDRMSINTIRYEKIKQLSLYVNEIREKLDLRSKISIILMISYMNNIVKRIKDTSKYINIFLPYSISEIESSREYKTSIRNGNENKYMIYMEIKKDEETNKISICHTIDIELMRYIGKIINKKIETSITNTEPIEMIERNNIDKNKYIETMVGVIKMMMKYKNTNYRIFTDNIVEKIKVESRIDEDYKHKIFRSEKEYKGFEDLVMNVKVPRFIYNNKLYIIRYEKKDTGIYENLIHNDEVIMHLSCHKYAETYDTCGQVHIKIDIATEYTKYYYPLLVKSTGIEADYKCIGTDSKYNRLNKDDITDPTMKYLIERLEGEFLSELQRYITIRDESNIKTDTGTIKEGITKEIESMFKRIMDV